jgi:hypothetical protein
MLDEIERRVEHLRETAQLMEQERESLLEMLGTLQINKDMLKLGQGGLTGTSVGKTLGSSGDREDMQVTMDRLIARCRTVQVLVDTPRNADQQRALNNVNEQIESLIHALTDDVLRSKEVSRDPPYLLR